MEEQQAPAPRETPVEVRNRYGIRAGIALIFLIWFSYDGWFNENIEAKTFNKVGAVLIGIGFLFCAIMAGSAALTAMREKNQPPADPPPQNPPTA
jgi:hypothetical protein